MSTHSAPAWKPLFVKSANANKPNYVTFCTVQSASPPLPHSRTIVYRGLTTTSQLIFHTDIRASKIGQIEDNNNVSVTWYATRTREQFRFTGTASLIHPSITKEGLVDRLECNKYLRKSQWGQASEDTKASYGFKNNSGFIHVESEDETPDLEYAYTNFAVMLVDVSYVDYLNLKKPQTRMTFVGDEEGVSVQP